MFVVWRRARSKGASGGHGVLIVVRDYGSFGFDYKGIESL